MASQLFLTRLRTAAVTIALLHFAAIASGQTRLWTGITGPNWDSGVPGFINSWSSGTFLPEPSADVVFGQELITTVNLNGNRTVNSLTFNAALPFTLNNNQLTITAGAITTTGDINTATPGSAHTIASHVALPNPGTWNIGVLAPLDVTGNISGSGFTKAGAGTLTLSGTNTYSGGTVLNEGRLEFTSNANLGAASSPITFTGGTLASVANSNIVLSSRPIVTTNTGDARIDIAIFPRLLDLTSGPGISGPGGLIKTGAGTLGLAVGNTYGGATQILGGALDVFFFDERLPDGTAVTVSSGASLRLFTGITETIGSLSGSGSVVFTQDLNAHLRVGANNTDSTFSGSITQAAGGSGSLTKIGAGTWTLDGGTSPPPSTPNDFAVREGQVVLDGAAMSLSATGSTGFGGKSSLFVELSSALTLQNGAVLDTVGTPQVHNNGQILVEGSGTSWTNGLGGQGNDTIRIGFAGGTSELIVRDQATVRSDRNLQIGGTFAPNPGVAQVTVETGASISVADETIFAGPGSTLTVDGSSFTTGFLTGDANQTIRLSDPVGGSALIVGSNTATGVFSGDITDAAGGPGSITKVGSNAQALRGANTYTGPTVVNAGTLFFDGTGVDNKPRGNYIVNGGSLILWRGQLDLNFNSIQVGASGVATYGSSQAASEVTVNGGFLTGTGIHQIADATFNGGVFLSGARVSVVASGTPTSRSIWNNVVSGGQTDVLFGRQHRWNGGRQTSAGVLNVDGTVNVSAFESSGVINVSGTGILNNTLAPLVLGGGSRTFVGTPAVTGGTIDLGGQTLELNGGLLVNNGQVTNGTVNVNFGSVAKGDGTYGPVNIGDGGVFSPGNSPGTAVTGDATWDVGGQLLFEIADAAGQAGTDWDLWQINGALSVNATATTNGRFTIKLATLDASDIAAPTVNFDPLQSYDWLVATTSDGVTGFTLDEIAIDASGFLNPLGGGSFSLAVVGNNDLHVRFTAVPEPGTAVLLSALGLVGVARRRRSRASN